MSRVDPLPKFNPEWITRSFEAHENKVLEAYRETHGDILPSTPFVIYIEARYELNPLRFTHYHPRLGEWIKESLVASEPPPSTPGHVTQSSSPPGPPQGGGVPEPSSWVLWAIGLSAVLLWRKWQ
jgi:hypothetical protein